MFLSASNLTGDSDAPKHDLFEFRMRKLLGSKVLLVDDRKSSTREEE